MKAAKAPPPPPPAPKIKFRGKLLEHEPLARYTTWRLGGPARYLALPADSEDVVRALELAQDRGLPWLVLGLGSNVLIKDGGFPGVVIRLGKGLDRFEMKGATAIVGAGMPTPILARRTAEAGFVGVERFIGIPGTLGGGIFMNAGCHGAEFAEIVTEVTVMDPRGKVKQLSRKQISFKYRASNLEGIVLEAKLGLGEESPAKLKELQAKLFRWRKAGTPFDQPCCGSTFTNPSGSSKTAGMLIDECGLKGFTSLHAARQLHHQQGHGHRERRAQGDRTPPQDGREENGRDAGARVQGHWGLNGRFEVLRARVELYR